ncbi:tetratricopeptide repeat protein [Shewanella woodyi]|uniref:tetratricopeptide repeat protein n=1 Tax=Shewanella woodyi TaxID=60961 RepID=UPI0037499C28
MDITAKIEKLELFLQQDQNNLNLSLDLIYLLLDAGYVDKAASYLDKALLVNPESSQLAYVSALISSQKHDYIKALNILLLLLDKEGNSAQLLYQTAYCYLQLSQPENALRLLTIAAEYSQEREIVYLLGRTQYQLKMFDLALSTLIGLAEKETSYAPVNGLLSQLYIDIEQWDSAQEYALKTLELDTNNTSANVSVGYIVLQSNQYDKANQYFSKALELKEDSSRTHLGLGTIAVFQQRYAEAEQHLHRALNIQADLLPAINLLGWLYILTDRFGQAREVFESGVEIDRSYAEMYGGIAVINVLEKNETSARKNVSIASRLDKTNYSGNFAKILLLQNSQQVSQAEKVWAELMSSPVDVSGKTFEQAIIEKIREYLKVTLH